MTEDQSRETSPGYVMIVDDQPDNLTVLEETLSRIGYRVSLFPRGDLALASAREEPPDLALFDIRMPGMDGYELCRLFKEDDRLASIPILFVSALTATDDITTGFNCGGVDYIAKPFREQEVLARVHIHIELRRAYEKLARQHTSLRMLEEQRDTYVHMLVHDLRSPLMAVRGHLELVATSPTAVLSPDDLNSLGSAIHGTSLLTRMISTVIDLSRLETEEIPLNRQPISVSDLVDAALRQAQEPQNPRPVNRRFEEGVARVNADPDLSIRILVNLLSNAFKYSPSQTPIRVTASPAPDGMVRIAIEDKGPGIPPKYQARIFEKFGIVPQSGEKRIPSTGLGLAFCRKAVEIQGGRIGLVSQPAQGSTFWFTLPACP